MQDVTAADAAVAVIACRHEAADLLARAANGEPLGGTLPSALASVRAACSSLDWQASLHQQHGHQPLRAAVPPQLNAASAAWRSSSTLHAAPNIVVAPAAAAPSAEKLLVDAKACLPANVLAKVHLHVRSPPQGEGVRRGDSDTLELALRIDGVLNAVLAVCFVPTAPAAGSGTFAVGTWQPRRIAIGPSHEPMEHGASQPARTLVFQDLTARAGALLVALDAKPAPTRLASILRWIASYDGLFASACCICGGVFAPHATAAVELLPPTARCARLLPYHAACFTQRFGRSAESDYISGCTG